MNGDKPVYQESMAISQQLRLQCITFPIICSAQLDQALQIPTIHADIPSFTDHSIESHFTALQ